MTHPGLFGALVIALAAGWIARRVLLRRPSVFQCLVVGAAGALIGVAATALLALPVTGALGLFAAATGGAIFLQAMLVLATRR